MGDQLPLLDWRTVDRLVRESGAVDRPMLASYLRHQTTEKGALDAIKSLRRRHPTIWTKRETPPDARGN